MKTTIGTFACLNRRAPRTHIREDAILILHPPLPDPPRNHNPITHSLHSEKDKQNIVMPGAF